MALTLSVLDQSPVRSGSTALDAIEETIKLAQVTEALGYVRYWLAEYHGTEDLAGSSPRCCWLASARPRRLLRCHLKFGCSGRRQIAQLLRPRSVCRFRSRTSLTRPTRIALLNTIAEPLSRPIFLKRPKRAFVFSRFALRHRRKLIASPSAVRCGALCLRKEPSDRSPVPKRPKPTHIRTPKNGLLKQANGAALSAIRLQ
jgi:hypothetical protein